MAKPRGIRNHNPFNIRYSASIKWLGQVGQDQAGFVVFKNAELGIRAAGRLLRTYRLKYDLLSIEGIICRWAPKCENDTRNYILQITRLTGLSRSQKLNEEGYCKLASAMIKMENGQQPYDTRMINKALLSGLTNDKSGSIGILKRIVRVFRELWKRN